MNNDIELQQISDEGMIYLKENFDTNYKFYFRQEKQYFQDLLISRKYLLGTGLRIDDFTGKIKEPIKAKDSEKIDYGQFDVYNAKVIHRTMRNVPRYMMMDDRMWAWMTHTIMWDYIVKRRAEEAFSDDSEANKPNIMNSFFTWTKKNGRKRGTMVNPLSRLWWSAEYVYDKDNPSNPYELLDVIADTGLPSTIIVISSSNILSNKHTLYALLYAVKKVRLQGYKVSRDMLVLAAKYLNFLAGITVLDAMDRKDLEIILEKFLIDFIGSGAPIRYNSKLNIFMQKYIDKGNM